MKKAIYFVSGLPRSGSTVLMNILAQNPRLYVTPTSGILNILVQIRDIWDKSAEFRALPREISQQIKIDVIRHALFGYFAHVKKPVCLDKNRIWLEYLEMAAMLLGGRNKVKVIVTVRDLREVLASFEKLYRSTIATRQVPQEGVDYFKMRTALGRCEVMVDNNQPVGRAFNAIRDAVTRGWRSQMHIIEYQALTNTPEESMRKLYEFLGEQYYAHDFDHIKQITVEDDFVHGFTGLHQISPKLCPSNTSWEDIFDASVTNSRQWKNIERVCQFWKSL